MRRRREDETMREFLPLLIVGAIIGVIAIFLTVAYALIKDKKQAIGFDRNMRDSEIIKRLLRYAKPFRWNFVIVGVVMLFSIANEII